MSSEEQVISNYWTNEPNIKEAKTVFLEKGIIKRELISDQLAFSWLRCKYKNTPHFEALKRTAKSGKRIPSKQVKNAALSMSEIWIALFDDKYDIIAYTGSVQITQILAGVDFAEASMGTNGIGGAIESGKLTTTIGLEHYAAALEPYVTIGIPLQNLFVGVVIPLQIADDEMLHKILAYTYETLFEHEIGDRSHYNLDLYFFRKDIQVYKSCAQQFNTIANRMPLLWVSSSGAWEGYALAQAIHENSTRKEKPFTYICNEEAWRRESFLEEGHPLQGTLVIENIQWFTQETQRKLNQFIESKLINSKPYKSLFKSDIAIIFIDNSTTKTMANSPKMYLGLQSKLAIVNLIIPSFEDIGLQFKSYLYTEFEKICIERYNSEIYLGEEALKVLTLYKWVNQYTELLYVVDYVIHQTFEGNKIPLTALPDYVLRAIDNKAEKRKLKEHEQELIHQLLINNKGNIKKTAEMLGITRTTLYKKIEEYNINSK